MLTEVNCNLKYNNARLQYGFECTGHPPEKKSFLDSLLKRSSKAPLHLCTLKDENSPKMNCVKDPNNTIIPLIDSRQTIWFKVCH